MGGSESSIKFIVSGSEIVLAKLKACSFNFNHPDEKIPLSGFENIVNPSVFNDSTAFGLKWSNSPIRAKVALPQYFNENSVIHSVVTAAGVKENMVQNKFESATIGKSYSSPIEGAWAHPGPVGDVAKTDFYFMQ